MQVNARCQILSERVLVYKRRDLNEVYGINLSLPVPVSILQFISLPESSIHRCTTSLTAVRKAISRCNQAFWNIVINGNYNTRDIIQYRKWRQIKGLLLSTHYCSVCICQCMMCPSLRKANFALASNSHIPSSTVWLTSTHSTF